MSKVNLKTVKIGTKLKVIYTPYPWKETKRLIGRVLSRGPTWVKVGNKVDYVVITMKGYVTGAFYAQATINKVNK